MSRHLKTVNFGSGNAGLTTVGYTLYKTDGTVHTARTTSGVFEVGTSTGIYGCNISFPDKDETILLWDTGGASPRYATDESTIQLNVIQEETDNIRIIWNSLKNQGELYLRLLEKLDKLKPSTKDFTKDISDLRNLLKDINGKQYPNIKEIRDALSINLPAPIVNIPEIKIPDYTGNLIGLLNNLKLLDGKLSTLIVDIKNDVSKYSNSGEKGIQGLIGKIDLISKTILNNIEEKHRQISKTSELKTNVGFLLSEINKLQKASFSLEEKLKAINDNITNTMKPAKFLQDIYQIIKSSEELKILSEDYKKKIEAMQFAGLT